jgi:hypothetical protein
VIVERIRVELAGTVLEAEPKPGPDTLIDGKNVGNSPGGESTGS